MGKGGGNTNCRSQASMDAGTALGAAPPNAPQVPADLSSHAPSQVDELWLEALGPALTKQARAASLISGAEATIQRADAAERAGSWDAKWSAERRAQGEATLAKGYEMMAEAKAEYEEASAPFDAEFERRGGWNRYLRVANTGGHVHRGWNSHCSTLRATTWYSPEPRLSGMSEPEVVDTLKYDACSVCFPAAPVMDRAARERVSAEKKREKDAEREAKRREKLTKAAVRAQKLMVKVEKFYATHGGREAFLALDSRERYDACYAEGVQATVGEVAYDDWSEAHGERRYRTDPREVISEARDLGLIED